jgi:predicted DNA-binding transcriptional regulator AlpA
MKKHDAGQSEQALNIAAVEHLVGLTRSSILRLVQERRFPAPLAITPYSPRWLRSELVQWLASRPRLESGVGLAKTRAASADTGKPAA